MKIFTSIAAAGLLLFATIASPVTDLRFPTTALTIGSMPQAPSVKWLDFKHSSFQTGGMSVVKDPLNSLRNVIKNVNFVGQADKHSTVGTDRDLPKGSTVFVATDWLYMPGEFTQTGWCLVEQLQESGSPVNALSINQSTHHAFMQTRDNTTTKPYDLGLWQLGHWSYLVVGVHIDDKPNGWIEWWFGYDKWPDITQPPTKRSNIDTYQSAVGHITVGQYGAHNGGAAYVGYFSRFGRAATALKAVQLAGN